jgi:MinD-like ATPase involved in chromosome partitioning or flagellar assembly
VLITLISAKGSPGTTTASVALAAASPPDDQALVLEIDPSGGDIEALTGITGEPGLLRVANDLRRQVDPQVLPGYAVPAPPGIDSILSPTAGPASTSLLGSIADRIGSAFSQLPAIVVADAGRWSPRQASAQRIAGSDVVVLVCRPTVSSIEHVRHLVDAVRQLNRAVSVLLVGDRPYGPTEVAAALETHVVGALAWDPGAVASLWSDGVSKRWARSWLGRSAAACLDVLVTSAADRQVVVS